MRLISSLFNNRFNVDYITGVGLVMMYISLGNTTDKNY